VAAAGPLTGPNGSSVALRHIEALGSLSSDAMRAWFARRPIFASTALYEPFGLAVLEAAQAGCPLVLSDIPTFRELWSSVAEFVDPGDAQAVAARLASLAGNADRRKLLGEAARERSRRYTVAAMTEEMLAIYRSVTTAVPADRMAVA
jgi:glycosyltransferase involved in cell wall biosynthesis